MSPSANTVWPPANIATLWPIARVASLAAELGKAAPQIRDQLHAEGLGAPLVARLAEALVGRADRCAAML